MDFITTNLISIQNTECLSKYEKCGEVYKSPMISEKRYMFLSCLYCKDIYWQLDTFVQHMEKEHLDDNTPTKLYVEEDAVIENTANNIENSYKENTTFDTCRIKQSLEIEIIDKEVEKDPLDEEDYELSEILPVTIKIENPDVEANECVKLELEIKPTLDGEDMNPENTDHNNESANDDSSDDDYEDIIMNAINLGPICSDNSVLSNSLNNFQRFLKIGHWNITSFCASTTDVKIDEIRHILEGNHLDIVGFSETWLKPCVLSQPGKDSTDDEHDDDNPGDYDNEDDDCQDAENDKFNITNIDENEKTNLKRFTKNREFLRTLIMAYQKQCLLWDSAYKNKKRSSPEKQKAYKKILKEINEKFKINATIQQIERIIKRLRLRYIHQTRMKDSGETHKPLWFYDLLKFIQPHFKEFKLRSGICKKLNDDQFLTLIKLFKENECFWNANNIYHTSVINKQEYLQSITNNFSSICQLGKDFNADIMQSTIDELLEMAREENANKLKHEATNSTDEYQPVIKFYKELQFLLPHVGPFKCKYCPKTFSDVYVYKFHTSKHEGTKPFKCMLCPRELTHKKEFVCHLRRHTKECPFQCDVCDKSFPSQKEWHRHVIKHGSKPYVCELCADSFYTQHQLTNHMKNHNNIRDHVCTECGKGFTHRGLLRQHLQTHNKAKCLCTLCDNIYSNPRSLRKHYVRVHESGKELSSAAALSQYNCKICKITFPNLQDANQHRKEHKQSNPAKRKHICDICGHHFAYPRNLADHKKTHSNIRDQVCDVCGKAFTNANLLNQHRNVHNGEKFVCKACGKDYAHYRGLCRHITKVHGINIKDLDALLEKQKLESSSLVQ